MAANEKEWVQYLQDRLSAELQVRDDAGWTLRVGTGKKLTYAHEILRYSKEAEDEINRTRYETDLLLYDDRENGDWIPRLVIECKTGGVTTHDALTYSTKAQTHKHVHPYLRYGILVSNLRKAAIPGRLIRHGAYFDFMMVWANRTPTDDEWVNLIGVLRDELTASRILLELLTQSRLGKRTRFQSMHRRLDLK
jgi:hypothetical protein